MNARFMDVELLVERGVLVPRAETELLGATALELAPENARIIDMCCGSGNLACALASRSPGCRVWASDLTDACVSLAKRNTEFARVQNRVEVVQGNVVTKEQAQALKPGMNRAQVRDILGSPLLTDAFHQSRWDYVFTIRRQGAQPQQRRVVVLFDGEQMKSVDTGGELPGERDFVQSIDTFKTARNAPPLALSEAQLKALPPPRKSAEPEEVAASAASPVRTYPPLEAR